MDVHKKMVSQFELHFAFHEQVRELTEKIHQQTKEDDAVMATVNTYVEEWKVVTLGSS